MHCTNSLTLSYKINHFCYSRIKQNVKLLTCNWGKGKSLTEIQPVSIFFWGWTIRWLSLRSHWPITLSTQQVPHLLSIAWRFPIFTIIKADCIMLSSKLWAGVQLNVLCESPKYSQVPINVVMIHLFLPPWGT